MRQGFRLLTVAAALLAAATVLASPPAPVGDALAMLYSGRAQLFRAWRYQETITGSQGSERIAHDPSRAAGARWRVLEVNGKKPSAEQGKQLSARATDAAKNIGGALGITSDWLTASEYRLVETNRTTLVYQLRPRPGPKDTSETAKLLRHLAGRFVVARDDHRPISLRLDNFESFSPRFGVRVEDFGFRVSFRRLGTDGPVVVERTSTETRGKVFWLKHFDDRTEIVLSDFAPVAASAARAAAGG